VAREKFEFRTLIPASSTELFDWHRRWGAFDRLSPPWIDVQVLERGMGIENGARVVLLISNGPIKLKWTLEHTDYVDGEQFADRQVDGPFAYWHHVHHFEPLSQNSCYLNEIVEYELPAGELGEMAGGGLVHRELERLFKFRHRTLSQDCQAKAAYRVPPLKVLISGSTGLIGSALIPFLTTQGHSVTRLVRRGSQVANHDENARVTWDPYGPELEAAAIEGFDAVVHLAGDNIGSERWTPEKKKKLLQSRLKPTQLLVHKLNQLERPPAVLISASAIGLYGDRGTELLTEESSIGRGFLADVCDQWEESSRAVDRQIRLVNVRTGVVLTPRGGALQKMLLPFKMGAGGPIGSGKQYFSWVDIDDVVGGIYHAIITPQVFGPLNLVAPNPVTNGEFTRVFGHVLERLAIMPMPAVAARAMFGEMADECLLASQQVMPQKLMTTGYNFRNPELETSLRHVLGKFITTD